MCHHILKILIFYYIKILLKNKIFFTKYKNRKKKYNQKKILL